MNVDLVQELLNELGSSLETLETEHGALLQFLKDKKLLTDDEFAPYLAESGKASSVRWRAAHIRLERLISTERDRETKLAEDEKRRAGAVPGPVQNSENQGRDAKNETDADGAPQSRGAEDKTHDAQGKGAVEGAGKQVSSDKDTPQVEPASKDRDAGSTPKNA